jgi:predicted DNA repair protein MutK
MESRAVVALCGACLVIGLLIGLMVRGQQVTALQIDRDGLKITTERQRAGMEGLGVLIQSRNR